MSKPSVKEITDPKLACRQKFKLNKTNKQKTMLCLAWGNATLCSLGFLFSAELLIPSAACSDKYNFDDPLFYFIVLVSLNV